MKYKNSYFELGTMTLCQVIIDDYRVIKITTGLSAIT